MVRWNELLKTVFVEQLTLTICQTRPIINPSSENQPGRTESRLNSQATKSFATESPQERTLGTVNVAGPPIESGQAVFEGGGPLVFGRL